MNQLDVAFYKSYYADLSGFTDEEAHEHYRVYGQAERRYPNLAVFVSHLEQETRVLPEDFDPREYVAVNQDLKDHLTKPWEPILHYMRYGRWEGRHYIRRKAVTVYDAKLLHRLTLNVFDMPEIVVDHNRRPTINVLVPAFDFASMSAGFFGVFQVARFIRRCGHAIRLVMYDEFAFDEALAREKLQNYPGLECLFDELEVAYIGDRKEPLRVSHQDGCVATVWYSAYLARKIMELCGGGPFLYLIQDYETVFHPSGSHYASAEATYSFDYWALFSTAALREFFVRRGIGVFGRGGTRAIFFNNACSSVLEPRERFLARARAEGPRRLAFYSRPPVHRNMFELGALSLCEAYRAGVFSDGSWEFLGIGLGEAVIKLAPGIEMRQVPRMNLRQYQNLICSFDVGFCLMASSHPSLLPFDLAGSGAVVVTNSFGVKDQAYFDALAPGVIVREATIRDLVDGLRHAVAASSDLETRYRNAEAMTFPRRWEETFGEDHVEFIRDLWGPPHGG